MRFKLGKRRCRSTKITLSKAGIFATAAFAGFLLAASPAKAEKGSTETGRYFRRVKRNWVIFDSIRDFRTCTETGIKERSIKWQERGKTNESAFIPCNHETMQRLCRIALDNLWADPVEAPVTNAKKALLDGTLLQCAKGKWNVEKTAPAAVPQEQGSRTHVKNTALGSMNITSIARHLPKVRQEELEEFVSLLWKNSKRKDLLFSSIALEEMLSFTAGRKKWNGALKPIAKTFAEEAGKHPDRAFGTIFNAMISETGERKDRILERIVLELAGDGRVHLPQYVLGYVSELAKGNDSHAKPARRILRKSKGRKDG